MIDSPAALPEESKIVEIREPWMKIEVITPTDYYGPIMELVTKRRGEFKEPGISRSTSGPVELQDPAFGNDRRFLR